MTIEERGKRIRELREDIMDECSHGYFHKVYTQNRLAEEVGISRALLSMIESGQRDTRVDVLKRIADVLEVDIKELL